MMNFSRAMLRALGKGVDRLNDGDLRDRSQADEVVSDLLRQGYVYDYRYRGAFLHRNTILVNGHMHPKGVWNTDLTSADFENIIRSQGVLLPEMAQAIDEFRFHDLPLELLNTMASKIRDIRINKGLRFEPSDLA